MRFSIFSSFLQKFAFQRSKSQLKYLSFISAFTFLTFQLKKPTEKQKQSTSDRGWLPTSTSYCNPCRHSANQVAKLSAVTLLSMAPS
jgi:hypothetical protein